MPDRIPEQAAASGSGGIAPASATENPAKSPTAYACLRISSSVRVGQPVFIFAHMMGFDKSNGIIDIATSIKVVSVPIKGPLTKKDFVTDIFPTVKRSDANDVANSKTIFAGTAITLFTPGEYRYYFTATDINSGKKIACEAPLSITER